MGTVWMAQQTEPVKPAGRRSSSSRPAWTRKQVIARFEAERQALALMDHPEHRPRARRGGTTDAGRPYFVMELVKGVPITEVLRRAPPHAPAAAGTVHPRSARRCSTRIRRASSTATSSRPTCWSPSTTASRCPRSSTSAWPRRPGSKLTDKTLFTGFGGDRRHAGIHVARAGGAEPARHRHAQRHLLAGRGPYLSEYPATIASLTHQSSP